MVAIFPLPSLILWPVVTFSLLPALPSGVSPQRESGNYREPRVAEKVKN
jgi:hypothetical protein